MSGMDRTKLDLARNLMEEKEVDVLVASTIDNIQYLSGFRDPMLLGGIRRLGSSFCVLPLDKSAEPALIAGLSYKRITQKVSWIKDQRFIKPKITFIEGSGEQAGDDPIVTLSQVLNERGLTNARIGIEKSDLSMGLFERLRKALPKNEFVDAKDVFLRLRTIKSEREIVLIKRAADITKLGVEAFFEVGREDATEFEMAKAYQLAIIENGALLTTPAHMTIGTGPNSAIPLNPLVEDRRLQKGDILKADVGVVYQGYTCDFSRCGVIGKPDAKTQKLHDTLRRAIDKGIERVEPGVKTKDIYDAVRFGVEQVYPDYEIPVVGHGCGIDEHEEPVISAGSDATLQEGMVISIEAPYNILGVGGMNIEDMMLVTKTGHELISDLPSQIRIR